MKRNSMGLVWIFLATVFMHCENTAVEIDPAKAVSGKVKILELKEDNKTKLLYALEYDKDAKINKLTVSDNGTVKIYNVVLDSAGRVSKVIHAPAKDTSRYIYDNQKLLVGIEGSKKELFEYEAGKFPRCRTIASCGNNESLVWQVSTLQFTAASSESPKGL